MNVKSYRDLEDAILISEAIKLGASPRELLDLFPSYFPQENEQTAKNKAIRVYQDVCPPESVRPSRKVTFQSLIKKKNKRKVVSSFGKVCSVYLQRVEDSTDLSKTFLEIYREWRRLDGQSEESLTFQEAFAIFRYLSIRIVESVYKNKDLDLFKKCHSCKTHFLSLDEFVKKQKCPYCSNRPKK